MAASVSYGDAEALQAGAVIYFVAVRHLSFGVGKGDWKSFFLASQRGAVSPFTLLGFSVQAVQTSGLRTKVLSKFGEPRSQVGSVSRSEDPKWQQRLLRERISNC